MADPINMLLQGVRSNDICLRPHGGAARTPSRGDSAADAVLDKDIKTVLLQQQATPSSTVSGLM